MEKTKSQQERRRTTVFFGYTIATDYNVTMTTTYTIIAEVDGLTKFDRIAHIGYRCTRKRR